MTRWSGCLMALLVLACGAAADGDGAISGGATRDAGGDITGPASVTDDRLACWDGTTGNLLAECGTATITSNNLTGLVDLTVTDQIIGDDVQSDTITNEAGTGAPSLTHGVVVATTKAITCSADGGCTIGASATEFSTAWVQTIDDGDGTVNIDANVTGVVDFTASDQIIGDDVQADTITNEAGTGPPSLTYGVNLAASQTFDCADESLIRIAGGAGWLECEATGAQLQFSVNGTTNYLDLDSSTIRSDLIQANGDVRPDADGGAILGQANLRFDGLYLYPDSAPYSVASTATGLIWLTAGAGPYGSTDGCEQGGCPSSAMMRFDELGGTGEWQRMDGILTPLAVSTTPYTLARPGRIVLVDSSSAQIALAIPACAAKYDGREIVVKLDEQDASLDTVVVTPASGSIENAAGVDGASVTISTENDAIRWVCYGTGTTWKIY